MTTINDLFRMISAYDTTEISDELLNNYYIPMSKDHYTHLCQLTFSLVDSNGDWISQDTEHPELESIHNTILAELAASRADHEMDNIHIDPITAMRVDKHYENAIEWMKTNFGIYIKETGELLLPLHVKDTSSILGALSDASY